MVKAVVIVKLMSVIGFFAGLARLLRGRVE